MLKLQSRLGDWEFIRPGRELVKEGELAKISRKGVASRYLALLSDCLLYCSYHGSWAGDNTSLKVNIILRETPEYHGKLLRESSLNLLRFSRCSLESYL